MYSGKTPAWKGVKDRSDGFGQTREKEQRNGEMKGPGEWIGAAC